MTVLFYAPSEGETPLWSWLSINIYANALTNAGFLAVRLTLLVLGPTMLTYTTTPVELTDALESLLKPLSLIGLPVHYLAIIMQIALRLIPTFVEETDKIINAQKARCADFDSGNLFKRAKAMIPNTTIAPTKAMAAGIAKQRFHADIPKRERIHPQSAITTPAPIE